MGSATALSADLIQAYLETVYRVHTTPPIDLRIDARSEALAGLQVAQGVDCSAFITACNPYSQLCDEQDNAKRQQTLKSELSAAGLHLIDGIGKHPLGQWPGEPSVLVLGLARDAAQALGRRYQQNAIVWISSTAIPELILLR